MEGKSLADLFAGRGDPKAMFERMKALMDAEGLPYGERTHTYNSRLAHKLACCPEILNRPFHLHPPSVTSFSRAQPRRDFCHGSPAAELL